MCPISKMCIFVQSGTPLKAITPTHTIYTADDIADDIAAGWWWLVMVACSGGGGGSDERLNLSQNV